MIYSEIGTIGLSTEIETDSHEWRVPGLHPTGRFVSIYVRIWIRRTVIILDSKEGLKIKRKDRNRVLAVLGMVTSP